MVPYKIIILDTDVMSHLPSLRFNICRKLQFKKMKGKFTTGYFNIFILKKTAIVIFPEMYQQFLLKLDISQLYSILTISCKITQSASFEEKSIFWDLRRKKSVIAENMYKYNRKIGILGNLLVLFLVKDYILLNHVKKSQNKLIFLIFSVSSNNFWEHCSRVP